MYQNMFIVNLSLIKSRSVNNIYDLRNFGKLRNVP